jgi:outer membrane protein TolC
VLAFAEYQHNQGWEMDGQGDHWMAGLSLRYDLYSGGNLNGRIRQAQAELRKAEQALKKVELSVNLDQRSARISLSNAEEAVAVTEKMVEQALESAQLHRRRFETGALLASELIDAENRLTDARMRRAAAMAQRNVARANLLRAMGHL